MTVNYSPASNGDTVPSIDSYCPECSRKTTHLLDQVLVRCQSCYYIYAPSVGYEEQEQRKDRQPVETEAGSKSGSQDQKQDSPSQSGSGPQDPGSEAKAKEVIDRQNIVVYNHHQEKEIARLRKQVRKLQAAIITILETE